MEELKAMFRVCAHIKSGGIRCGSPAMTGMNFCFNHIGGKPMTFVRATATTTFKTNLDLVHPGTREAIQHNLSLVAQALNEGKLDTQTANSYIRLYRIAEQNLTRWEKANKNNLEKHISPLSPDDVILNEVRRDPAANKVEEPALREAKEPAVSPGDAGAGAPCLAETWEETDCSSSNAPSEQLPAENGENSNGVSAAENASEPGDSNQAIAAKHAAHQGRPLDEFERKYFGLPAA